MKSFILISCCWAVLACPYLDGEKEEKFSLLQEFLSLPVKHTPLPQQHQEFNGANISQMYTAILKENVGAVVGILNEDPKAFWFPDALGFTPFEFAIAMNKIDFVNFFLSSDDGSQIEAKKGVYQQSVYPPLHIAVLQNHTEVVELLLEDGFDVNLVSAKGVSPLMHALDEGHITLANILINAGANVDFQEAHTTLRLPGIAMVAMRGEVDLVRLLVKHGVDPTHTTASKHTGLMFACAYRYLNTVKALFESEVPKKGSKEENIYLQRTDSQGNSALLHAIMGAPRGPKPSRSAARPKPSQPSTTTPSQPTAPFDQAVSVFEMVDFLLKNGVRVSGAVLRHSIKETQLDLLELYLSPSNTYSLTFKLQKELLVWSINKQNINILKNLAPKTTKKGNKLINLRLKAGESNSPTSALTLAIQTKFWEGADILVRYGASLVEEGSDRVEVIDVLLQWDSHNTDGSLVDLLSLCANLKQLKIQQITQTQKGEL